MKAVEQVPAMKPRPDAQLSETDVTGSTISGGSDVGNGDQAGFLLYVCFGAIAIAVVTVAVMVLVVVCVCLRKDPNTRLVQRSCCLESGSWKSSSQTTDDLISKTDAEAGKSKLIK